MAAKVLSMPIRLLPMTTDRELLERARDALELIERAVAERRPVETLIRATGVWIDAEVKPLPFFLDWELFDYRLPITPPPAVDVAGPADQR